MNSRNMYTNLYETMVYFHGTHHQHLLAMQDQSKKAKTIQDLHRLATNIRSFCHGLHGHHTIEDARLFPVIARKTDISHLKAHHEQLAKLLNEFENCSNRLRQVQNSEEHIKAALIDATSMIDRVSTLVNEHERAEEQVIAPENMKKLFTESEMRQFLSM